MKLNHWDKEALLNIKHISTSFINPKCIRLRVTAVDLVCRSVDLSTADLGNRLVLNLE